LPVDNVPLREAVASFAAKPEQASYDDVVKEAATAPYAGLVINPSGPWLALSAEELRALL
jgi:hypothetical protein